MNTYQKYLLLILAFTLSACTGQCPIKAEAEINRKMELQRQAWNDGNLESFMQPYWNSEQLLFIGSSGLKRGWSTVLNNYKNNYSDSASMGELDFSELTVQKIGGNHMFVVGRWQLKREGKLEDLGGYFSLIWHYIDGEWYIIADHSS